MSSRPCTHAARSWATCGLKVPKLIRSATVSGSVANFRMVSVEPSSAIGGTTALTRLPSGRRASTIGLASSTRRPTRDTIRSITRRRCPSSANSVGTWMIFPLRSTKIRCAPLTMISLTSGSRSSGSIGPWPRISSVTSWVIRARSPPASGVSSRASRAAIVSRTRWARSSSPPISSYICGPRVSTRACWRRRRTPATGSTTGVLGRWRSTGGGFSTGAAGSGALSTALPRRSSMRSYSPIVTAPFAAGRAGGGPAGRAPRRSRCGCRRSAVRTG